jgi:conjugal transfer ATP-binding protein TraC
MQARARSRAKSLNTNANSVQQFLHPEIVDEQAAWNYVYTEGARDNVAVVPTFYNLVLFTTEANSRTDVTKAITAYRQLGLELHPSRATQWLRFLGCLPMMLTEGLFEDFETLNLIRHLTHTTVANMLPVVSDTKGSKTGMLLPTVRNQLFLLDTFDTKHLPITNFNFLTVGSSGAGKSMFQQAQILSGLALGEMTYVIDLGQSYKHLCELVGGTYIDAATMTLNPFTLFDFDGKTKLTEGGLSEEVADNLQIRDLLAIMASPSKPVCDIQKAYLLDAIQVSWQDKGRSACMDDILDALRFRADPSTQDPVDTRLTDLIILLNKFGSKGIYGAMFHGLTPLITNVPLVVFEMGGLQHNPELLTIVMFVMIVIIQGQFYHTDRSIKKRCIIDEAWRFLTEGSNPIAAAFIEQGFRTARKHRGGFGVITQYLSDTEKSLQGQAIAASSDLKIILRQGNFSEYLAAHPTRFTPLQAEMIASFGDAAGSGFSTLMLEAGGQSSFHRYFADPITRLLFSSSGDDFTAIEAMCAAGMPLIDAVRRLASMKGLV